MQINPPHDPYDATRIMLRRLIGDCPTCGQSLGGHAWSELGAAGNKDDMETLLEHFQAGEWNALQTIQSFVGTKNAIITIAVRCSENHGSALAYIDYFELYSSSEVCGVRRLGTDEWQNLLSALPDLEWHAF